MLRIIVHWCLVLGLPTDGNPHVASWYILRPRRGYHITTLGSMYIPYNFMEPLGSEVHGQMSGVLSFLMPCTLAGAHERRYRLTVLVARKACVLTRELFKMGMVKFPGRTGGVSVEACVFPLFDMFCCRISSCKQPRRAWHSFPQRSLEFSVCIPCRALMWQANTHVWLNLRARVGVYVYIYI